MNVPVNRYLTLLLTLLVSSLVVACGGGGGGGGGGASSSGDDVQDTLDSLGVDTEISQRLDDNKQPLPEDYSPLGSSRSFEKFDELLMLGFPLAASSGFNSDLTMFELDRNQSAVTYATDVLFAPAPSMTTWAVSSGDTPAALRVATRGDIDRDGLEEIIIAYRDQGKSVTELKIYEDQAMSFDEGQTFVVSSDAVTGLAIGSGDFNGDGYSEVAIGLISNNAINIQIIDNNAGILDSVQNLITLPQAFAGSTIELVIESGNLDYDPSHELVVVVNEIFQQAGAGNPETGTTRYFIFDDAKNDFAEIDNALIQADLSSVNRTAIVADLSLGDVDGDNLDELVFGGLTSFDPNGVCDYNYLLIVLDDLVRNNVPLGASEHQPNIHGSCSGTPGELRYVQVNTADLDGDGLAEIQANELIFEDFSGFPPWTALLDGNSEVATIPDDSLFADNAGFTGRFSALNSSMVAGDLTADKRQDIAFYSQSTNKLEVWGLSDGGPDGSGGVIDANQWRMLKSIAIDDPASADDLRPVLLPVNVNHDSTAISFDTGKHEVIFTEPVLIAALAAAPCFSDEALGQNLDACRTAYGTADSTTVALENTTTISAGVVVGFETEESAGSGVLNTKVAGFEAVGSVKLHASFSLSAAYSLTERVVYTTGPVEDTVIFTSIPYDVYTYTVTSNPDPEKIGGKIIVAMPRSPVTLQVERDFYNANVVHDGPKIDSSVFTHTAGNPRSYPGASAKDTLVNRYSGFLPTEWAYDIGPESVGQGGGDTTQEINIAFEKGVGVAVGVEAEFETKATLGKVVVGFTVGVSNETSLQITHGEESTYTGTVANLSSSGFADEAYDWGLFTYAIDDHASGQEFEVINYWVE